MAAKRDDAARMGGAGTPRDNDDYDPHAHRNIPKATTNTETLIHLLKSCLGTGVLAMPQGFSRSGLIWGIVGTVICGVLMTHCLKILCTSRTATCRVMRVPILDYPDSIKVAVKHGPPVFHNWGTPLAMSVNMFIVVYQLGICCVYIVFIADNIKKLVDPYQVMSLQVHMLIILIPLLVFNLIPSLKLLAPFTLFANIITMIALFIIAYYMLSSKKTEETYTEPIDYWGSITTFPLFFGTVLFALTSVPVVVSLEMNMEHPKDFVKTFGVLNTGMAAIIVLYTAVGICGYLFCKSKCSDSITLDLPEGPLSQSVLIMMVIAIFISYGLHCYVPTEAIWNCYVLPRLVKSGSTHQTAALYILRVVLCLLTFILAAAIPRLGLFISLFGAFSMASLGLMFPPLMDYCMRYPNKLGPHKIIMYKNIVLFIVGLLGLMAGSYVALANIVMSLF